MDRFCHSRPLRVTGFGQRLQAVRGRYSPPRPSPEPTACHHRAPPLSPTMDIVCYDKLRVIARRRLRRTIASILIAITGIFLRACHEDVNSALERFPAKWIPVRVKKTRQNKKLELRSDSIRNGNGSSAGAGMPVRPRPRTAGTSHAGWWLRSARSAARLLRNAPGPFKARSPASTSGLAHGCRRGN